MAMKNPSHPGKLIKADIDELGLSMVEALAYRASSFIASLPAARASHRKWRSVWRKRSAALQTHGCGYK